MKNIMFSAGEELIEAAAELTRAENTTLEELLRSWLEDYARRKQADAAMETLKELRGRVFTGGRKFTRNEMNER